MSEINVKGTILLIEASPLVRLTIKNMLAVAGYFVSDVSESDQAVETLETVGFDVLFCCASAGLVDCEKLAKQAKVIQPEIKIIVATNANEHPNLDQSKYVDGRLRKPFILSQAMLLIDNLIKKS